MDKRERGCLLWDIIGSLFLCGCPLDLHKERTMMVPIRHPPTANAFGKDTVRCAGVSLGESMVLGVAGAQEKRIKGTA